MTGNVFSVQQRVCCVALDIVPYRNTGPNDEDDPNRTNHRLKSCLFVMSV